MVATFSQLYEAPGERLASGDLTGEEVKPASERYRDPSYPCRINRDHPRAGSPVMTSFETEMDPLPDESPCAPCIPLSYSVIDTR